MKRSDETLLSTLALLFLTGTCMLLVAGCTESAPAPALAGNNPGEAWRTVELQDVRTGERFSIASISGTPVILYTFTVSCPICTRQQKEITALKNALGDGVVVIGLDIDPREEEKTLVSHIQANGFAGYYALSPDEMTASLVDRFGPVVVTPASAPVMVVCPGGNARLLDTGIKSASSLASSLAAVC